METYNILKEIYKKSTRIRIVDMHEISEKKYEFQKEIELDSVFNPVIYIKYSSNIDFRKFLTDLKILVNTVIIIPIIYLELYPNNLENYSNWIKEKSFFKYLRIIPVLIINKINHFEEIFDKLNSIRIFSIGFNLSKLNLEDVPKFLEYLKIRGKNKDVFIFLTSIKHSKLSDDQSIGKYKFPIYYQPSE